MAASRDVVEAAAHYAERYAIVAVRPDKRPWGDEPDGTNWRRLFTLPEILDRLKGPRCVAIGFLGGQLNHSIVPLDFDTEAAEKWWAAECAKAGIDPDDFPTVITPGHANGGPRRPGRHRYVTDIKGILGNSEGELRPLGINVRGNGHCMLPPSPHPEGGTYAWVKRRSLDDYSDGIPPCPAFVYAAVESKKQQAQATEQRRPTAPAPGAREKSWCMAALINVKQKLAVQPRGQRNNELNNSAMQLGHLAHFDVFTKDMALSALKGACADNGLIAQDGYDAFLKTFESGWAAGEAFPGKLPDEKPYQRPEQKQARSDAPSTPTEGIITGAELDTHTFAPVEWVIEGVLPTGLGLLAGKSKIGKSWLAMDLGTSVARGALVFGKIATIGCDVLYIALEDPRRRLQSRMRKMLQGEAAPPNLFFATQWPNVDGGCLEQIEAEVQANPKMRLVIVDTFGKVRGKPDGRSGVYQQDYKDMGAFHALALRLNIAILLIHHTRKQDATDVMDLISGSTGIVGAADTLMVLQRKRGEEAGTLSVTGRDIIEDGDFALTFHKDTCKWEWLGEAKEVKRNTEKQQILNFLLANSEPVGPTDIANELELPIQTVKSALRRLKKAGAAFNPSHGLWATKLPE